MEHRPTTTRANDLEIAWTGVTAAAGQRKGGEQGEPKKKKDHLFLSFTFVIIVSLSFWQKVPLLSISKELLARS
jgi:hypothetical protein